MNQISTKMGMRHMMRIALSSFFLSLGIFSTHTASAHRVVYYAPPCIKAGQQVILPVKVIFCASNTWYHWQYRTNNGAPGTWTFLNNGQNTINGTTFMVTDASRKTNVADSCASLIINNATTALNGIELRVLMGENADPQVVTSPVWGGSDKALHEVKMVRITVQPGNEYCYTGCTDNKLVLTLPANDTTPLSQFYGGFEAGSNNFGGTHANGSSVSAQTDLTQWTTGDNVGNNPRYRVTNNADSVNLSFTPFAPHSGRQQLVVSSSTNSSTKIWYKTILADTSPEQSYYFTTGTMKVWVAKVDGGANGTNPTIVLEIVGTNNANSDVVLASTSFGFTTEAAGQWVQISINEIGITKDTYKKIQYRIRNTNTMANSFALDDICVLFPPSGPLPVTLTPLKANYANGIANLNWGTQQESNSSHFEIERSNDGNNFSSIGKVAAAGYSSLEKAYRFNDIKVNNGLNYYRLKAVDKDGSFSYSNTVAVQVTIKGISITGIYPSPFVDKVNIALAAANNTTATIRLMDNTGRSLRQQTFTVNKGANNLVFSNLGSLAKGLYLVEVVTDGVVQSQKIIKQ